MISSAATALLGQDKLFSNGSQIRKRAQRPISEDDEVMANIKLTDLVVRNLRSETRQYEVFDSKQRGLSARVSKTGAVTFCFLYRWKGLAAALRSADTLIYPSPRGGGSPSKPPAKRQTAVIPKLKSSGTDGSPSTTCSESARPSSLRSTRNATREAGRRPSGYCKKSSSAFGTTFLYEKSRGV